MKGNGRTLIYAGIALAAITGLLVFFQVSRATSASKRVPMKPALVAIQDVPEATLFTPDNIKAYFTVKNFPADLVPANAIVQFDQTVGMINKSRIFKDEVILQGRLSKAGEQAGVTSIIPPGGFVALAVPITDLTTVAGAVQPNDRVDLVVTMPVPSTTGRDGGVVTQVLLQDVLVLRIGQYAPGKTAGAQASAGAGSMTLLLPYQDALMVEHLQRTGVQMTYILRRFDDRNSYSLEPVNTNYVIERFKLRPATP